MRILFLFPLFFFGLCEGSFAEGLRHLPGESMSLLWAIPFLGILLSIATGPILYHHTWENHYGKIVLGWVLLMLIPLISCFGISLSMEVTLEVLLLEYLPFIALLFSLFTIAGGIVITGNIHGSPRMNTFLLFLGCILASCIGTTGASMIMVRPVIRANDNRPFNVHVIIFFIFLVSNIGGSLTALGDPPLFVGFLRGIEFFWTTKNLLYETLFTGGVVLGLFFVLDTIFYKREASLAPMKDKTPDSKLGIEGVRNLFLLGGVIGFILFFAYLDIGITIDILGVSLPIKNLIRDGGIIACALISLKVTPAENRLKHDFSWEPMLEVGKLFAGIFVVIVPVIAILKAGDAGAMADVIQFVKGPDGQPNPLAFFWLTGILSSFLDNAPTYLIFFELAGGDPEKLMTVFSLTLAAISSGAVFMGANTYIGNAPNFMVYAIARHNKIKMPGFFGYMLWSAFILLPVHIATGFLFFS